MTILTRLAPAPRLAAAPITLCAALIALTAAWSAPIAAQEQAPAPGTPKAFRVPEHRTFTLGNGMQVTLIHYGTIPKALALLDVRTGLIDETPSTVGLAGLTANMLLEGTAARTSQQISLEAADLGGTLSAFAGAASTQITGEVLSEHAARFVSLVSDVAQHPRFDAADFDRVRKNAIRDLAITLQNAYDQTRRLWRGMIFPNHPFGRVYASEATLKALTVADTRTFHAQNVGAGRAHLYVSGVFDDAAVEKAARAAFDGWAPGKPATVNPATPVARRQLTLLDRPDAVQSTIWIGLPVVDPSHPDYVRFGVTDLLLGGAFGSRITSNIREDKGYTYSPFSTVWARKGAAYWVEAADVTTKDTGASLKEIIAEIERLRREAPPAAELEGIKQYEVGFFTIRNSSRQGIANQLQFVDENNLGESYLTNFVKNVMAVSPDDVRRMAQLYLDPGKMTIAVVGDKKTVEAQVAPYRPIVP
ncbi:MAG TPA: pitrilysin family protein [Gemmatimonadaceae bacterium]|nr:pitrilysin family protein [Gemmatimonadaceae bacterium]